MKEFFKLNAKELEASLIPETEAQIQRDITRREFDLEDAVGKAKKNLSKVSTITSLND